MKKDSDIIDIETGSGKRNIVSAVSAAACLFVLLIIYYALIKHDVAEDIYNNVTDETGVTLKNFAIAPDGVVSKVYISTIQSIGLIIPARKASWK